MILNAIHLIPDNLKNIIDFLGFTENDKIGRHIYVYIYENDIAKLAFYISAPAMLNVILRLETGDVIARCDDYIVEDENGRYYVYDSATFEKLKNKYNLIK